MNANNVFKLCAPALLVFAISVPAFSEQVIKLGYVDVGRVFKSYMKTKAARKDLDEAYNTGLKGIDARKSEIEDYQNELSTKKNVLSQERQDALKEKINEKLAELREYAKEADDKLQSSMDQRTQLIVQEVRKIVEQIATAEGYSVVFDKTVVLYVAPAFDLTQRVLDELNRSYAETAPAPDAVSPE